MSKKVSKKVVFITVIFLFLSFPVTTLFWSGRNDAKICAEEGGRDFQNNNRKVKDELSGDPFLEVESKKQNSHKYAVAPLTSEDSIFGSNDGNYPLGPDTVQSSPIGISGYPTNWIVSFVDVRYDIVHEASGQLLVYLRIEDVADTIIYPLFIGDGEDTTDNVHDTVTFIMAFEGKEVNQEWLLWVVD